MGEVEARAGDPAAALEGHHDDVALEPLGHAGLGGEEGGGGANQ